MLDKSHKDKVNYKILKLESIKTNMLEAISYKYKGQDIDIIIENTEYTSLCPMTGLPDFGVISIFYQPNQHIIELKSLKFYFLQYRTVGVFYEHLVNKILNDLVSVIKPKTMKVKGEFTLRGGIKTIVEVKMN